MNTQVVDASGRPALPAASGPMRLLNALPGGLQLRLALGVVALLGIAVLAWSLSRQPDWRVLFSNVSDKDGGAIVAQLSQMNVPYKHGEGGGVILVPADRVHDVRLRLASQGLPKGSVTGFEPGDTGRFGMTQFQERLSFQRGLEGELTRSIQSLASVQAARVHLALPAQNGFFREQQKPSASVLLTLHPGRSLDRAQVAGIVHLVASSVPDLRPQAVSVIDDAGTLLSGPGDPQAAVDQQQLQYAQQVERQHIQRITDVLEPVVGRGNVRAQVSAEIDFTQSEATFEQHKPNQTPDAAVVRSQQTVESTQGSGGGAGGVPGALSNQPPGPASAPINAPAGAAAANAATGAGMQQRRESTTNYEVDKTVRVVRSATGAVKRLNAAVVVNHRTTTEGGKTLTKPLSAEELEKVQALVREAIGFNKERGDSVQVMNTAFVQDTRTAVAPSWWQRPELQDWGRTLVWPVGLLLLALLVLMGFIRPALKAMAQSQAAGTPLLGAPGGPGIAALPGTGGATLDALVSDDPQRPALPAAALPAHSNEPPPPSAEQLRLEDARRLARDNPVAVANIVKGWVNGEQPA